MCVLAGPGRIYRILQMTSTDTPAPGTRTQWVDDRLRDAILEGELAPGMPLRAEELAQRWNVSPTPVREALQRLAGVGFVELRPQRGARVAAATIRDVEEVYELRLMLEPVALRESLVRADADLRAEITATCGAYEEALRSHAAFATMLAAHRAFHAALGVTLAEPAHARAHRRSRRALAAVPGARDRRAPRTP